MVIKIQLRKKQYFLAQIFLVLSLVTPSLTQNPDQYQALFDGLIHYFPFKENLQNYKDPTANASGSLSTFTGTDTDGNEIKGLSFPNDTAYHTLTLPTRIIDGIRSFTISVWLYPLQNKSHCILSAAWQPSSQPIQDNEFILCSTSYIIRHTSGWDYANPPTQTNEWIHLTFWRDADGQTLKFYLNGIENDSYTNASTAPIQAEALVIGNDLDTMSGGFEQNAQIRGYIKDLRIYNTMKTPQEINSIMNHSFSAVDDGLQHYYPFRLNLQDHKQTAHGSNYVIKTVNDRFNKPEKAMKFNNNNTIDTITLPSITMNGKKSFTITVYLNIAQYSSTDTCILSIANSSDLEEFTFCINKITLKKASSLPDFAVSSPQTQTNQWIHIALVRDTEKGSLQLYIDGILDQTETGYGDQPIQAEQIFFGNQQATLGGSFQTEKQLFASFQDLKIFDIPKSSIEIQEISTKIYCLDSEFLNESEQQKCIDCSYPCLRCTSPTDCLECKTTLHRTNTSQCQCQDQYFDNNTECLSCEYPCHTCETTSKTCLSCKGQMTNRNTPSSCTCKANFYDKLDSGTYKCLPCDYPCLTCEATSTNCLSCKGQMTNRNNDPTCSCINRYYDHQDPLTSLYSCLECPKKYALCSDTNTGSQCRGNNRKLPLENCDCLENHYEDPSSEHCFPCQYPCLSCQNSAQNCLSCKGNLSNRINDSTCSCLPSYYEETENQNCLKCPKQFALCTSPTTGTQCQGLQRKPPSQNCDCKDYHYSPLLLLQESDCIACSYPCQCDSNDVCITCKPGLHKLPIEENCLCSPGFYEDPLSGSCELCDTTICGTCNTGPQDCQQRCNETCQRCNPQGHCTQCKLGQYLSGTSCENCSPFCLFCDQNDPKICKICNNLAKNRSQIGNCACLDGYYQQNETDIHCTQCPVKTCKKCDNKGLCNQCLNSDLLPPLCQYKKSGFYIEKTTNSTQNELIQCNSKCESCKESPSNCSQCILGVHRSQDFPDCSCQLGFHDNNGNQKNCQKCPILCKECLSADICTVCKEEDNTILDSYSNQCECKSGYKWNYLSKTCQKCYFWNGECLSRCPQNTKLNEKLFICSPIHYKTKEQFITFWASFIALLFIMVLIFFSKIKLFQNIRKQQQKLQQYQPILKNSQSSPSQNTQKSDQINPIQIEQKEEKQKEEELSVSHSIQINQEIQESQQQQQVVE